MRAAIHRRDNHHSNIRQGNTHAANNFSQLSVVTRHLIVRRILAFICAVIENHQVWISVFQLSGPVLLVHHRREQSRVSAVDAEAVVDHTGPIVLDHGAEHSHITTAGFDFESVCSFLRRIDLKEP